MSQSHPDPSGQPAVTLPRGTPDVVRPWTVLPESFPQTARNRQRTVDPVSRVGAARAEEADPRFLVEGGEAVVDQLERAAQEEADKESGATCLAYQIARNQVTGEGGVIARRMLSRGRYSRPLAEIFARPGELKEETRNDKFWLGRSAANGLLQIVVLTDMDDKHPRPAAFAAIPDPEISGDLRLLARLLVTHFEISQWSDKRVEMRRDSLD